MYLTGFRFMHRSYADALHNRFPRGYDNDAGTSGSYEVGNLIKCINYTTSPEDINHFRKAFTRIMKNPGADMDKERQAWLKIT